MSGWQVSGGRVRGGRVRTWAMPTPATHSTHQTPRRAKPRSGAPRECWPWALPLHRSIVVRLKTRRIHGSHSESDRVTVRVPPYELVVHILFSNRRAWYFRLFISALFDSSNKLNRRTPADGHPAPTESLLQRPRGSSSRVPGIHPNSPSAARRTCRKRSRDPSACMSSILQGLPR